MGTIWVREFKGGLDARRLPEATSGGVLIKGQDGHINRGGEFEQRYAFVEEYTLPAGTVGLAGTPSGLYVFGADAEPGGVPAGVTYQRLENGSADLTRVRSYDLFAGKIYAVGDYDDGTRAHFYDGTVVSGWADGRARASFQVVGGGGTSTIQISVNGITIMSGAVTWATSNSATATAIATAINSYSSTPDYSATSSGDVVYIIAASAGTSSNGLVVAFTLVNSFSVDPTTAALSGGADGSFPQPGTFVKTIGSKVYALASQYTVMSGIQQPTLFTGATGSGFIDMSQQTSGAESLSALGEYNNNLTAVFAERVIMTWSFASDVAASVKQQTLRNTGTASPRSVTQVGDADLYYLDESGLRSLRARLNTDSATTSDIGNPVDDLITAKLASLSSDERLAVIGLINPGDGRFWLIMKDVIYVFTYFAGSKVSAWTSYTPPADVDDACIFNRRVYLRCGDTIYCYGGIDTGTEYDDTSAIAWLPGLDGDTPMVEKTWTRFDAVVRGLWEVYAVTNPNTIDTAAEADADLIARIWETTYNNEAIGAVGASTHVSLRFKSIGTGPHKLAACAIHFDGGED